MARRGPPASSTHARAGSAARLASMSITESAISACTMPCSSSRSPNASRSRGAVERDVERAAREPEPAHAVRQPRRREAHLGVAEALPDLAEHRVVRRRGSRSKHDLAVPAGRTRGRCVADRAHDLAARGCRRRRGTSSRPRRGSISSAVRAMQMAKAAPSAPVMNHLRAVDHPAAVDALARVVRSIDGSEPAPGAGSVIAKHERTSPAASGRR